MSTLTYTPFTPWPPRKTADPRNASQLQYMHGLTEILEYEAPIQALAMFQTYAKASGLMKIAAPVRKRFERALLVAEKAGQVIIEREDDSEVDGPDDSVGWIVRLPDQDPVNVRTLGDRGFAEIPMSLPRLSSKFAPKMNLWGVKTSIVLCLIIMVCKSLRRWYGGAWIKSWRFISNDTRYTFPFAARFFR